MEYAVVAGATGALGRAIVDRLTERGLHVVAIARDADTLAELASPAVMVLPADLGSDSLPELLRGVIDGPVRIVVQAAGLPSSGDVDDLTGAEVIAGINIKIGGFIRMIDGVRDHLVEDSRLVALGGHYGFEPSAAAPLAGMVNAALNNLARTLADQWGPRGVTVHIVAPGPVESPRMTAIAERIAVRRDDGSTAEDVLGGYRAASPLNRLTTIDEVAWAVELLLAPQAAAMLGSVLSLDAGRRRSIG